MAKLFEGARQNLKFVFGFVVMSVLFWAAEFAYQFYFLIPGELAGSILRGSALAGATFIGVALFLSAVFRWFPNYGKYWYVRRSFGVVGTSFVLIHIIVVMNSLFQWNLGALFWSMNPIENPLLFGILAIPVFFLMTLTSTDWAYDKMGVKKWKTLHRFVYFGYMFAIFHFLLINPALLMNPAGYALIIITFLALAGQLFWFIKTSWLKKFSTFGTFVGFFVIFLYLMIGYFAFLSPYLMEVEENKTSLVEPGGEISLEDSIREMTEFMEQGGIDEDVSTVPIAEDQEFSATLMKSGMFERVNYMTDGSVTLQEQDGKTFVVFEDDFSTPNGPDLVVYLTKNSEPTERNDVSEGQELGELKSTVGKQVYEIPAGVDVNDFSSVTIHCRAFNVPWSYARLN